MRYLHILAAAVSVLPGNALAQQAAAPAPAGCKTAEFRTLDFWVGEWIAEWEQNGQKGTGTNRITRDEYGDCVITEHFRSDDGSLIGHSVSTYRPGMKQWRQTWVDNQNGYFDLAGGPVAGSDHAFVFENKRISERQPFQRMIFQDVKPDSFTWRWQRRARAAGAWTDDWVIKYRRKGPAAGQ